MREKFVQEMAAVRQETMEMGRHAEGMLSDAVKALKEQDVALAEDVVSRKGTLLDMDDRIEEHALRILTLHQPMAVDLRTLACILKMNTYLTRIGRYGYDIARVALEMADQPHVAKLVKIPSMAARVNSMVDDALDAFRSGDTSAFDNFTERDDDLDQLRWSIFREAITYMMEDPKNITRCMHYVMIARYLERCGDHACKMAEKIVFMVSGERVEIS